MSAYRTVKREGRTRLAHRAVWEEVNGPIPVGYVIHHRNGNKRDNRPENLELMTHAAHSRLHNDRHPRQRRCGACGETYTPEPKHRGRSSTCSPACFRVLIAQQKRGASNPQAKLTADLVLQARRRRSDGERLTDLCSEYGVSMSALSQAVNGKTWGHL